MSGQSLALATLIKHAANTERWSAAPAVAALSAKVPTLVRDDRVPVRSAAAFVAENMLRILMAAELAGTVCAPDEQAALWKNLVTLITDTSPDVRLAALLSVKTVCRTALAGRISNDVVEIVLVPTFNCLRDRIPVSSLCRLPHHRAGALSSSPSLLLCALLLLDFSRRACTARHGVSACAYV